MEYNALVTLLLVVVVTMACAIIFFPCVFGMICFVKVTLSVPKLRLLFCVYCQLMCLRSVLLFSLLLYLILTNNESLIKLVHPK